MRFIGDFHIHSRYSRATSKDMNLENLDIWARIKGMQVLGTGDFTNPAWFKDLKTKLEPAEPGLYRLKRAYHTPSAVFPGTTPGETRFILTVEISNIYSKNGRTRRIHNLVFAPSLEIAEKINTHLSWVGNLASDGRPILGLDSEELVKIVLGVSPECVVIPAHAWTPWFSLFGSMSGFDTIEECFGKYTEHIFAIETGLSSDPAMNRRVSSLDQVSLISNSDSHSLTRIGREANIFDTELSYAGVIRAIRSNSPPHFTGTIEFFPEEGKYHYDGHRNCGVRFTPEETKAHKGRCPKCDKPLTVGVLARVEELADKSESEARPTMPVHHLIPLDQIIADALGTGVETKGVKEAYRAFIQAYGNEFRVLLETSRDELSTVGYPHIAEGIMKVREGKVHINPGYDGEYGSIRIFDEATPAASQQSLF